MRGKRWGAALLGLAFAAGMCGAVYGMSEELEQGQTVGVEELDLSITFPKDWVCFNSGMAEDDPVFSSYGLDGSAMLEQWKTGGVFIDALDLSMECTVVHNQKGGITHLSQYTDEEIRNIMDDLSSSDMMEILDSAEGEQKELLEQVEDISIDYREIVHKEQATYMVGDSMMKAGGQILLGRQYYTVVNGNYIAFNFNSLTEEPLTEEQKLQAAAIMNTVEFGHLDDVKPAKFRLNWEQLIKDGLIGAVIGGAAGVWLWFSNKKKRQNKRN